MNSLSGLGLRIDSDEALSIASGRNQSVCLELPIDGQPLPVLVKSFGRQSLLKDWLDLRFRKSKAQRSFEAASLLSSRSVATPMPIAYIEGRQDNRLTESYYLSLFLPDTLSLQQAMLKLLHGGGTASEFMALLDGIARECRRMHDAGFMHNDLGNQNILLREQQQRSWIPAGLIDLNRGRILGSLSLQQRARDLARLNLPSNLLLMFLDMYWGAPASGEFIRLLQKHHRRFRWRERTRILRHPVRETRILQQNSSLPACSRFPAPRNLWIWDDTSDQALAALDRPQRVRQYPIGRSMRMLVDTLAVWPKVWTEYRQLKPQLFASRRPLNKGVALALDPDEKSFERTLELLGALGDLPVLVRFYHHQDRAGQELRIRLVNCLHSAGHAVTAAFVQDRRAILEPTAWHNFVLGILEQTADALEAIEFGHAINRVKWGVWSFSELRSLYAPLKEIADAYPDLEILGPATIDFEYPFLISALKLWPESVTLAAMSHHLYVDRRGAPENRQNGFGALEKFALARAVASAAGRGISRVVVSEVNWPLYGTGKFSPVTMPFDYRKATAEEVHDTGVDEQTYAAYMVRYLALALCSGMVDRVCWWQLVARGYGLVDRNECGELRKRPAYFAMQQLVRTLENATVLSAQWPRGKESRTGEYRILLRRPGGEQVMLCWRHGPAAAFPATFQDQSIVDCFGNELAKNPEKLEGLPVYVQYPGVNN